MVHLLRDPLKRIGLMVQGYAVIAVHQLVEIVLTHSLIKLIILTKSGF